jgi:uncharacterized membrane protein YbhN (UPF0104 family)
MVSQTAGRAARARAARSDRARWLTPAIAAAVICVAGVLLYRNLRGYSWDELVASVTAIPHYRVALAVAAAAASYFCLTWFDWLALRYVKRNLPYPKAALASFVALSLGHNIGLAALSSGAIRYRFYSRWGVRLGDIAKIIIFCGVTVGLGLLALAAWALLLRSDVVTKITGLPQALVLAIGAGCLAAVAGYVALSFVVRAPLRIRKWTLEMPPPRLAAAQVGIGLANFACVAACLHHTLAAVGEVTYLGVAAVYVIANTSALITHVPGGLGVIETVVTYLLPAGNVIGALIAFRAIYYLLPLCVGGPLFALAEFLLKKR